MNFSAHESFFYFSVIFFRRIKMKKKIEPTFFGKNFQFYEVVFTKSLILNFELRFFILEILEFFSKTIRRIKKLYLQKV